MITIPQIRALGKLNPTNPTAAASINERPQTLNSLVGKGYAERKGVDCYVLTNYGHELLKKYSIKVLIELQPHC